MTNQGNTSAQLGEVHLPVDDDSMEGCFQLFTDTLQALAGSPGDAFAVYGGFPAAAWELKSDLVDSIALVDWMGLPEDARNDIAGIIAAARLLPPEACAGESGAELNHPTWRHLSGMASAFLAKIGENPHWCGPSSGAPSIE